jgi:hypothetical protein
VSDDYDPEMTHDWNDEDSLENAVAELQEKAQKQQEYEDHLASLRPEEREKEVEKRERREAGE